MSLIQEIDYGTPASKAEAEVSLHEAQKTLANQLDVLGSHSVPL